MRAMMVHPWEADGIASGKTTRLIRLLNPQPRISTDLVIIHGSAVPRRQDGQERTIEECLRALSTTKPGMEFALKEDFRIHLGAEDETAIEYRGSPGDYYPHRPRAIKSTSSWTTWLKMRDEHRRLQMTITQVGARALDQLTQDDLANTGCATVEILRGKLEQQNYHWANGMWAWLLDFTPEVIKQCS